MIEQANYESSSSKELSSDDEHVIVDMCMADAYLGCHSNGDEYM